MDTEHFIVRRHELIERLESRRLVNYPNPFRMGETLGYKLPMLAQWVFSLAGNGGGMLGRFLEIGLPLAIPLLFRKKEQSSFIGRIAQRFFSPKA